MIIMTGILLPILLIIWSPWMSDEFAVNKVIKKLGGPDAKFSYLGEEMVVKDVPKVVAWLPFGRAVYFPSEGMWFVTFYGDVV